MLQKCSCDSSLHVGLLVCVFVCTNLLCRKQHAQIWFVFQLPRARDKFSLTALRRLGSGSEKDSLASMQSNYANTHICRASQCSHSGQEWSCSLTRSKYRCGTPGLKSCKKANSCFFSHLFHLKHFTKKSVRILFLCPGKKKHVPGLVINERDLNHLKVRWRAFF